MFKFLLLTFLVANINSSKSFLSSALELISSFSPKTEAETSFEETTTTEVAGTSRADSPTLEQHLEEPSDNLKESLDLASNKDIGKFFLI